MPMFRVRLERELCGSASFGPRRLPIFFFFEPSRAIKFTNEMGKRAVRLRHFVCVFAFLDRVALTGGRRP